MITKLKYEFLVLTSLLADQDSHNTRIIPDDTKYNIYFHSIILLSTYKCLHYSHNSAIVDYVYIM
jgi:hypothetical protein